MCSTQIAVLARAHHPHPTTQSKCLLGFTRPTCVLPGLLVMVLHQGQAILMVLHQGQAILQGGPFYISATETVLCYSQRIQMQTAQTR